MKTATQTLVLTIALVATGPLVGCAGAPAVPMHAQALSENTDSEAAASAFAAEPAETESDEPRQIIPPQELPLPHAVAEIVRLAQSGVDEEVLLAYIDQTTRPYELTADDIIYLNDIGLSSEVITSMIQRSGALRDSLMETLERLEEDTPPAVAPEEHEAPMAVQPPALRMEEDYAHETPLPPTAPQEVHGFYHDLAPYGTWLELPGHGWVWQPTVARVNVHWRPYYDRGRWFYSTHGWYWHSYYSWGWAPFHYGRWHAHPVHGWVWFPDTVWGPAWVTWRSYDVYSGWAPLPPHTYYVHDHLYYRGSRVSLSFSFGLGLHHYSFVPKRYFCDPFFHRHTLRGPAVQNVFVRSTVINNIVVQDNRTIINKGIDVDRVRREMRSDVPRVAVRDLPRDGRSRHRPDQLTRERGENVVFRQDVNDAPRSTFRLSSDRDGQEVRRDRSGQEVRRETASGSRQTAATPESTRSTLRLPQAGSDPSAERGTAGSGLASGRGGGAAATGEPGERTVRGRSGDEGKPGLETRPSSVTSQANAASAPSERPTASTRSTMRLPQESRSASSALSDTAVEARRPGDTRAGEWPGSRERSASVDRVPGSPGFQSRQSAQQEVPAARSTIRLPSQSQPAAPSISQPAAQRSPATTSPAPITRPQSVPATRSAQTPQPHNTLRLPGSQPQAAAPSVSRPAPAQPPTTTSPAPITRPQSVPAPQPRSTLTLPSSRPQTAAPSVSHPAPMRPPATTSPAPVTRPQSITPSPSGGTLRLPGSRPQAAPPSFSPPAPAPSRHAVAPVPRPQPSFSHPPPARSTMRLPSQPQPSRPSVSSAPAPARAAPAPAPAARPQTVDRGSATGGRSTFRLPNR